MTDAFERLHRSETCEHDWQSPRRTAPTRFAGGVWRTRCRRCSLRASRETRPELIEWIKYHPRGI